MCPSISWSLLFPGQVSMTRFVSSGQNLFLLKQGLLATTFTFLPGQCAPVCNVFHVICHVSCVTFHMACVQSFFCCCNFVEQVGGRSVKTLLISIEETRMSFVHSCDFTRFQPLTAIQAFRHFQLFYPLSAILPFS